MIKIQANITGFGKPATVFAMYDEKSRILLVSTIAKDYQRERLNDCLLITNDLTIERDALFSQDDFKLGIAAFFEFEGSFATDGKTTRLIYQDDAQRAKPTIEKDGIDENGYKYRVSEDAKSEQIAVLAICLFCHNRLHAIDNAMDMFDELNDFNSGSNKNLDVGDVWSL